jgi:hypothetical protein
VAAEVLLQNYASASDPDALAWVAKALGKSHNGRYYGVLKEVNESKADKKVRKYTAAALKEIGAASGEQYVKGKVNLQALRNKKAPAATAKGSAHGLDVIRNGMSMQEAYDLVGTPTSSSARPTGKAFIPYNYSGSDTVRRYALYKGKGRIVFSRAGHYDSTMRVIEVHIDTKESGYP